MKIYNYRSMIRPKQLVVGKRVSTIKIFDPGSNLIPVAEMNIDTMSLWDILVDELASLEIDEEDLSGINRRIEAARRVKEGYNVL